jgi:hypothetical protein
MNCKEFETLVNDLARKRMMDASLRDATCSHAKDCARCNARLAEEKQLTVGLRALAILDENQKAPANVEANLLSAFRKHAAVAPAQVSPLRSSSFAWSRQPRLNRWWAAAAVIFILFAIAAWRLQNAGKEAKVPEHSAGQQEPKQQELPANHDKNKQVLPASPAAPPHVAPSARGEKGPNKKASPRPGLTKDLNKLNPQIATNASTDSRAITQAQATQAEITTPYMSLTQGYTLPMPEGGQVLRVELPRSALASFGLPVYEERLNERVKADVVIGNDGIARAIRFVR